MGALTLKRARRLLLLAALTLAVCAASAGAVSGVSISPGGAFQFTSEAITLNGLGVTLELTCAYTIRGRFFERLVGISGENAQIGELTGISWSGCEGGLWEGILNMPWALTLDRLDGANPRFAIATELSEARLRFNGVEIRLTGGEARECLWGEDASYIALSPPLTETGERGRWTYTLGASGVSGALVSESEACGAVLPESGRFSEPTPTQRFIFLVGGEVREGITPNPVDFGTVEPEALRQMTAAISTTRGGRVEEISVLTGRYFSISDPNECRGRFISSGRSCDFTVILSAPGETGRELSDTVTVRLAGRSFEAALRART